MSEHDDDQVQPSSRIDARVPTATASGPLPDGAGRVRQFIASVRSGERRVEAWWMAADEAMAAAPGRVGHAAEARLGSPEELDDGLDALELRGRLQGGAPTRRS